MKQYFDRRASIATRCCFQDGDLRDVYEDALGASAP